MKFMIMVGSSGLVLCSATPIHAVTYSAELLPAADSCSSIVQPTVCTMGPLLLENGGVNSE